MVLSGNIDMSSPFDIRLCALSPKAASSNLNLSFEIHSTYFKSYVLGTQKNRLNETVLLSTKTLV